MKNGLSILEKEQQLFNEWSQGRSNFCRDGVVCEDAYRSGKKRILIVLREINFSPGGERDLRHFLNTEGGFGKTWINIARWVEGVQCPECIALHRALDWKHRRSILRSVAAINLNKTPGKARTDFAKLEQAVQEDKSFLRRQIDLYAPHLILACGSEQAYPERSTAGLLAKYVLDLPGWRGHHKTTTNGVQYMAVAGDCYVVGFRHPSRINAPEQTHNRLVDAVREIEASGRGR